MNEDLRPVEAFLIILTVSVLLLSFSFCGKFKVTESQMNILFETNVREKCEKPCCHLLFNRFCRHCREYRLKNGYK